MKADRGVSGKWAFVVSHPGEEGDLVTGDICDDGDLHTQAVRKVKAMTDVSEDEAMVFARWGAVKWVGGEPRAICDNRFDSLAEPNDEWPSVKHDVFVQLVRCAFDEKALPADIDAILKRSMIIVNTDRWVYYRKAGTEKSTCPAN